MKHFFLTCATTLVLSCNLCLAGPLDDFIDSIKVSRVKSDDEKSDEKSPDKDCKGGECKLGEKKGKVNWKELLPEEEKVPAYLQDISVTIKAVGQFGRGGTGSGVVKTRICEDGTKQTFIWTAAHVVDSLRHTRDVVDPATGTKRTIVEFEDPKVVKEIFEDGRNVGRLELDAEVIRYSDADNGEDLALLKLRKKNFIESSAVFYLDDKIPSISTKVLHVGSLLGQVGANSLTDGIVSQHGRLINKKIFDQITAPAFPGSSGGGVFLANGAYCGMLVRGAGETFCLIVPVRRMVSWAKKAKVEWALDDNVPVPSEDELRRLPVEDIGKTWKDRMMESTDKNPYHDHPTKLAPLPEEKSKLNPNSILMNLIH